MGALADKIRKAIKARGGWLGFDAFMQLALYEPELGYYCGGGRPFDESDAARGDFVTAPMLGPWLGQSIWDWSAPLREELAAGASGAGMAIGRRFYIREFGAGRGDLAAALLRASQGQREQHGDAELCMEIIELSADMQRLQRSRTAGLGSVSWSASMTDGFQGLVLANEVLDAMPVRCFEWAGDDLVLEWGIAEDAAGASGFAWSAKPADAELAAAVLARQHAAERRGLPWGKGYRGEHATWTGPWLTALGQSMDSGAVLLMDYGQTRHEHDSPGRTDGTLCAHRQHHRIDDRDALLKDVGQQDLTAHVDFSLTAQAAKHAGFEVHGFVTQARFLMNAGLLQHAQQILEQAPDAISRARLAQSLHMLLSESEMGEVFKVMLLTKGLSTATVDSLIAHGFTDGSRLASLWDEA